MPKTCENLISLVNICIYYACQMHGIYEVLPYSVDFKAFHELWNPLSKRVLKSDLNVSPVDILLIFDSANSI